jgi:hypothetical protein
MANKLLVAVLKILLFFAGGVLKRLLRQLSDDVRQEEELALRNLAVAVHEKNPKSIWTAELIRFAQRVAGFPETYPKDGPDVPPQDPSFDAK